jgi:hypothetical protein
MEPSMPRFSFALVVLVALTGQAWGGFQEGLAAFYRLDYQTALKEFERLAEEGDTDAQYQLAIMYYRGEGVPQDYGKARMWYRRAADRGDADAQLNLGLMYAQGVGVAQNFVEAFKWFELAVAYGPREDIRSKAFLNRENAASMMTKQQIERAERWARAWKPKHP